MAIGDVYSVSDLNDGQTLSSDFDNKFNKAIDFTFRNDVEGGYTVDHAGPTKFGITQKFLDQYSKRKDYPTMSVKDMTLDDAKFVAKDAFFNEPNFGKLPERLSVAAFDYGLNSGQRQATIDLQRTVGAKPDGQLGNKTLEKVNEFIDTHGEDRLLHDYTKRRENLMNGLIQRNPAKYGQYQNGWNRRIQDLKKYLNFSSLIGEGTAYADDNIPAVNVNENLSVDELTPSGGDTKVGDTIDMAEIGDVVDVGALDAQEPTKMLSSRGRDMSQDSIGNTTQSWEPVTKRILSKYYDPMVNEGDIHQDERRALALDASFQKGLYGYIPPDVVKNEIEKHPVISAIGENIGGLIGLIGVGAGVNPVVKKGVDVAIKKSGLSLIPWIQGAANIEKGARTFGAKAALDHLSQAVQGQPVVADDFKDVAKQMVIGAGFGVTEVIPNPVSRISAQSVYMAGLAKMQGASDPEVAINGMVGALFGLANRIDLNLEYKKQAVARVHQDLAQKLSDIGFPVVDAVKASDQFIYGSAVRSTGKDNVVEALDTVLKDKNNSLSYFEELDNKIKDFNLDYVKKLENYRKANSPSPEIPVTVGPESPAKPQVAIPQEKGPVTEPSAPPLEDKVPSATKVPGKGRTSGFRAYPQDLADINEMISWELEQPNGERTSYIDAEGNRQWKGIPSGHSKTMQEIGPQESFKILKMARDGEFLTKLQEQRVQALLKDYRENVQAQQEKPLEEAPAPVGPQVQTGTHTLSSQEDLSEFVDQVHEAGGEVNAVRPDPANEDGYVVDITVPEQKPVVEEKATKEKPVQKESVIKKFTDWKAEPPPPPNPKPEVKNFVYFEGTPNEVRVKLTSGKGQSFPEHLELRGNTVSVTGYRSHFLPIGAHFGEAYDESDILKLIEDLRTETAKNKNVKPKTGKKSKSDVGQYTLTEQSVAEPINIKSTSVRNNTQIVKIKNGLIEVTSKSGKDKIGTFNIPLSKWEELETSFGNPNYNKKKYIEQVNKENIPGNYTDDKIGDPFISRIEDAQISAINEAFKKYKEQNTKAVSEEAPVTQEVNKKSAYDLGKQAFQNGVQRVPAMDKEVMELIKTDKKNGFKIMTDWYRGWDEGNIKEPVEDEADKIISKLEKKYNIDLADIQARADAIPEVVIGEGKYTQEWLDKTVKKIYGTGARVKNRRVDFVVGIPASGKGKFIKDIVEKYGSIDIDNDNYKAEFDEFNKGLGAQATHDASTDIEKGVLELAANNGDNIAIAWLGKNPKKVPDAIKYFKELGYSVHVTNVVLPVAKAMERAVTRYIEEGRYVSPKYIHSIGLTTQTNNATLVNERGLDSYDEYSTDVAKGAKPIRTKSVAGQVSKGSVADGGLEGEQDIKHPPQVRTAVQAEESPKQLARSGQPRIQSMVEYFSEPGSIIKNPKELRETAQAVFGGDPKSYYDELYDAIEMGLNRQFRIKYLTSGSLSDKIKEAIALEESLPLRNRSLETIKNQQFSTPLPLATAANHLLNIVRDADIVLEPTAGTGNLIIPFWNGNHIVLANELDPRRVEVLRNSGFPITITQGDFLKYDGRKPTAIISNPPFGALSKGKYVSFAADFKPSNIDQRFIAKMIRLLPEGGRIAVITSQGTGSGASGSSFRKWLEKDHTFLASIPSPIGAYKYRGSPTVETALLMIEKGKKRGQIKPLIKESVSGWDEYVAIVEDLQKRYPRLELPSAINNDIIPVGQVTDISNVEPGLTQQGETNVIPNTPAKGAVRKPTGKPAEVSAQGSVGGGSQGTVDKPADGSANVPAQQSESRTGVEDDIGQGTSNVGTEGQPERPAGRSVRKSVGSFIEYKRHNTLPVVNPHPSTIVESKELASVEPPQITYKPSKELFASYKSKNISDAAMDVILLASQSMEKGKGFLIADDVGVGKTREMAGIILEALSSGKANRVLYVSISKDVVNSHIAGDFSVVMTGQENNLLPYKTIRLESMPNLSKQENIPVANKAIYTQTVDLLKQHYAKIMDIGFDLIVFDEAHKWFSVDDRQKKAIAWNQIHKAMFGKPMIYATATPGLDLSSLDYLYGLGEWTEGTFDEYLANITGIEPRKKGMFSGGGSVFASGASIPLTQQFMREMKMKGLYMSRDIARSGVKFATKGVPFDAKDISEYDRYMAFLRKAYMVGVKYAKFNKVKGKKSLGLIKAMMQNAAKRHQVDLKIERILPDIRKDIADGKRVFLFTNGLNEIEEGAPKGYVRAVINAINEDQVEKVDGEVYTDKIPEAIEEKYKLLDELKEYPAQLSIEDYVLRQLGSKYKVGFYTGNTTNSQKKNYLKEWMRGNLDVMLGSDAAKTAISAHDTIGKEIVNYYLDIDFEVTKFKQALGRTNRSGEKTSPSIIIPNIGAAGEQKFVATIATRMKSLGATSKGQAESGVVDFLSEFDLEGTIAHQAARDAFDLADNDDKELFLNEQLFEIGPDGVRRARRVAPANFYVDNYLFDLNFMPYEAGNRMFKKLIEQYKKIVEDSADLASLRAEMVTGKQVKEMELYRDPQDPNNYVMLHEVLDNSGHRFGIVTGKLLDKSKTFLDYGVKNFIRFTTPEGIISGKKVLPSYISQLAQHFGKDVASSITVDNAFETIMSGDKVPVIGDQYLYKRKDGNIAIHNAKMADKTNLINAGAGFTPVGSVWILKENTEQAVKTFLKSYPLSQSAPKASGEKAKYKTATTKITPSMRDSVMSQGQPLFKQQLTWDQMKVNQALVAEAEQKGRDLIRQYLPQMESTFENVPYLYTEEGKRAVGIFFNKKIKVVHGAGPEVYIHEIGHAALNMFLTPAQKRMVLDYARQKYEVELPQEKGETDQEWQSRLDDRAEEYVMDDLEGYAKAKAKGQSDTSILAKVRALFDKIISAVRRFLGLDKDKIKAFYDDLLSGKFKNAPDVSGVEGNAKYKGLTKAEIQAELDKIKASRQPKAEGEKERKFIKTVRESDKTAPEVKETIESYYEPITNKATMAAAQDYVTNNYQEAVDLVMGEDKPTAFSNAVAIELVRKAQVEGRLVDAVNIVERTAEKQTALGQAIQALSMYNRLSPEGILLAAQREFKKARTGVPKEKLDLFEKLSKGLESGDLQKLSEKMGIPVMTPELAKKLIAMAEEIKNMPEGRDKQIKTALMLKEISDTIPRSFWDKVSMVQTLAQLLNPKTLVRNILGNLLFQSMENLSDLVATGIDIATALKTGKRTVGLPSTTEQIKGAVQGYQEGLEEVLLGVDIKQSQSKFTLPKNGVFNKGVMGALEKTLRISLGVPDRMAYQSAFNDSLRQQMMFAKASEPTEEMIERAHQLGLYRTFQDDNVLSRQFVTLKRWFNVNQKWGLGDMVLKYPKTPANILARGIEYSPFGFAKTIYTIAEPMIGREFDQEAFSRGMARAMTGSVLLVGVGAMLAAMGIISGKRSKDKDVEATRENVGIRDYQVNASALLRFASSGMNPEAAKMLPGDQLFSYDWLQPASIGFALGANMAIDPKTSLPDKVLNMGERVMQASETLQEQPLVQGVKTLFNTRDVGQGVSDLAQGIPASFMPTLFNQVKQIADNTARNTRDPNYFKEMYNKAVNRVPFASESLPPRITTLGENKQMYQDGSNNIFNVFFNPAFASKYEPDPVSKMVLDIWESSGETIQFPRMAKTKVKLGSGTKEEVELTPEQYLEYQKYIGNKTNVAFSLKAQDEEFMALDDEQKAKILQRILTNINSDARRNILLKK